MNFWVPVVFGTFKILVLGTGMFFAIKSHYDGEKKGEEGKRGESTSGRPRRVARTRRRASRAYRKGPIPIAVCWIEQQRQALRKRMTSAQSLVDRATSS